MEPVVVGTSFENISPEAFDDASFPIRATRWRDASQFFFVDVEIPSSDTPRLHRYQCSTTSPVSASGRFLSNGTSERVPFIFIHNERWQPFSGIHDELGTNRPVHFRASSNCIPFHFLSSRDSRWNFRHAANLFFFFFFKFFTDQFIPPFYYDLEERNSKDLSSRVSIRREAGRKGWYIYIPK